MSSADLNDEQMAQLQDVFNKFDKDKSGEIDANELSHVMEVLGYKSDSMEAHKMLQQADKSKDGLVSFEEFANFMAPSMLGQTDLGKIFKVIDKKSDGFITIGELKATLDALGEKLTEEEIDEMMREADTSGDGKVDIGEFTRVVS